MEKKNTQYLNTNFLCLIRKKILIIGCGADLKNEYAELESEYEIIALFDNNKKLHGKVRFGKKIYHPDRITDFTFDFIKICSLAHTNKIRSQIADLGISLGKILPTPLFCDDNFKNWEKLKKQRNSDRIFIIGNGPSLRIYDLDLLHKNDELSFAFNKIYLAFEQTDYRPTYFMVEDLLVLQNISEKINSLCDFPKFIPEFAKRHIKISNNDFVYGLNSPHHENLQAVQPSTNFRNFGWGGSVTCSAIQAALFLGYKKIYLLGVDNSYKFSPHENSKRSIVGKGERNHFHPDYRPVGEKWNFPPSQITNDHYIMLKKLSQETGSQIINCTRGGKVEVFERKPLEKVLN